MECLTGDARVFAVINTAEYNNDGNWAIQTANGFAELKDLGFTNTDWYGISELAVGEMLDKFDFKGVIVIRIA